VVTSSVLHRHSSTLFPYTTLFRSSFRAPSACMPVTKNSTPGASSPAGTHSPLSMMLRASSDNTRSLISMILHPGSCEHRGGEPPLALFSRVNSLYRDDPAVHCNRIGAGVLVVTRTARTSAVQRKPLKQVSHASGRRS